MLEMENRSEINFVKNYQPGLNAVVELTNGRFVDVMNDGFFDQHVSVLIRNGEIISMPGLESETSTIKSDFAIDLKGKTVLPGFFNVHCHTQMINPTLFSDFKTIKTRKKYHDHQVRKNMADCLVRGITHIRDTYSDDLRPNRQLNEHIRNQKIPGPRILQAVVVGALGGYLSPEFKGIKKILMKKLGLGNIAYGDFNSGVVTFLPDAGEQQVRDAVNRAIDERGADLIKVGESLEESLLNSKPATMSIKQMQAITDQARLRNVQSTIHCVSVDTFRRAIMVGFSSLAHMARDGELTQKDIDACLNSDCIIEPTLSVGYDMSWRLKGNPFSADPNLEKLYEFRDKNVARLVETFWIPELKESVMTGFNKANRGQYKLLGIFNLEKLLAHFIRVIRFGIQNTKRLVEQGAIMACGNDGGIQSCTPAMIAHELAMFDLFINDGVLDKKFNGAAAVRTATINSAKSMGIDNRFGSIQTGKTADLVVVDGNPFEKPAILGKIVDALFMDGRLIINNCGLVVQVPGGES